MMLSDESPFVIHAKAGIQESRDGFSACDPWMPAFAGMTVLVFGWARKDELKN